MALQKWYSFRPLSGEGYGQLFRVLVTQHEFKKAAREMKNAARLAASQHFNFDTRTHTHRDETLMQHGMAWQTLHPSATTLSDSA